MRATLFVTRLPRALVVPRQALERTPDGQRIYVRRGERFVPRPVTIGPGNGGLVVVTAGLAAGDEIALRPPGASSEGGDNAAAAEPTVASPSAGGGR